MSQEKAQLIAPQGHFTVPGLNVAGVVTASSFSGNCTGTASSLTQGSNVVVGVMTASSFAGDVFGNAAGLSTTTAGLKLGIVTSTSFAGNFTGIGSGLTGTPNIVAGLVTASQFVGNTPGLAAGLSAGKNLAAGIITATTFHGDGSGLTGAGSTAYIRQTVGSGATINLNDGNIVNLLHITDSTVSFANTSTADDVTIIRPLDLSSDGFTSGAVDFDGSGDYLEIADHADFDVGTNWTAECWFYADTIGSNEGIFSQWDSVGTNGYHLSYIGTDLRFYYASLTYKSLGAPSAGQWHHVAISKSGSTTRIFLNGSQVVDDFDMGTISSTSVFRVGRTSTSGIDFDGKISNLRIVQGTSVYTYGFTPPLAALTNITNTKLLCCQDTSSTTVGAVKPGTITAVGSPSASSNSIYPSLSSTLTWPDSITWNGGTAPTLAGANSRATAGQVFNLVTYNGGTNWYGYEEVDADPQTFGLFAWGANGKGQLAQNSATYYSSPVQVPGTTWSTLAGGLSFNSSGAIKSDGTLWMWGDNGHGNLGLNDTIKRSSPTQIPSTTWSNVSAGGDNETSTIAIKTDGTMWAWGGNDQGNLGHNNRTDRSSPTQIPGTTWKDVSNGADWVVATKTDGTAWSWGKNSHGYLGLNNTTEKSSPTQIPGTTWAYAAAGRPGNNVAVKTDGTLWAWGHNGNGALGQNNTTNYASPKQIPGTSWDSSHPNKVNAGFYRAFAIKTDGTLWGWGANSNGELGNNNRTQYSSPVQIPGTNWESIDNMYSVTLATKTDGTLWSWGYNYGGVLGLNTSNPGANHSSPVQIPGSWKLGEDGIGRTIAAHQFSALALRVE